MDNTNFKTMKITLEQEEIIYNCGAFEYSIEKMANILDLDVLAVKTEMKNTESHMYNAYNKGIDKADYLFDKKLFDLGIRGDVKAIEKFEARKHARKN